MGAACRIGEPNSAVSTGRGTCIGLAGVVMSAVVTAGLRGDPNDFSGDNIEEVLNGDSMDVLNGDVGWVGGARRGSFEGLFKTGIASS